MQQQFKWFFTIILLALITASCGSSKKVATKQPSKQKTNKVVTKKPLPKKPIAKIPESKKPLPQDKDKVSVSAPARSKDATENYVDDFASVAMEEMKLYRIPASITLAQGILESGSGAGRLALEGNNHFGIKCHKDWTGGSIKHDDDALQECFRTYKDASYSYRDHSLFLSDRKRYAFLFSLGNDDYVAWARGLRKAGYATDPKYPEKLIGLIERYELFKYDAMVLGKEPMKLPEKRVIPKVDYVEGDTHRVAKGDTLYNISKRYGLTVEELQQFNSLSDNNISLGQIIYVSKPKK